MDLLGQLIAALHLREIAAAAAAIQLVVLSRSTTYPLVLIGFLFTVVFALETLTRANRASYLGRTFRQDVVYALSYQGVINSVLTWTSLAELPAGRSARSEAHD